MALTAEQIAEAKREAIEFLEYSIYTVTLLVGMVAEEVSGSMVIPVDENHPSYPSYVALKEQAAVLEGLTSS